MEHRQLPLDDGRLLAIEVSGPEDGRMLLWHHGTPGSSHQPAHVAQAAHVRGLRLVTTSRPGYTGSTRTPGRSVADVVADVSAVLDALGVDDALVAGWSGGGPHALACAALLGDRVRATAAVCSVAPHDADGLDFLAGMGEDNVEEFGLAREGERRLRPYLEQQLPALVTGTPAGLVDAMATLLPEVDRRCLTGPVGDDFVAAIAATAAGGADGWVDDDLAFTRPWGFALSQIQGPVSLWQGSEDLMVPFSHGQWLTEHIPGVEAHLETGEGHLSINVGSIDRILDELITAARQ